MVVRGEAGGETQAPPTLSPPPLCSYVKGGHGQSLWVRNLQLSLYGAPFALAYALVRDGRAIAAGGAHQGFDSLVWSVIALQVAGGVFTGFHLRGGGR